MSQENLEMVERAIRAAIARPKPDYETMNELYAADHVLVPAGVDQDEHGAAGFREWRENVAEDLSDVRHELNGVVDLGPDKALAVTTTFAEGKTSGVQVEQRTWNVVTIKHGRIIRTEAYTDWTKALRAASPPA
jgi:ketosteroid isomerase-like protein